jgi:hypothetical protein
MPSFPWQVTLKSLLLSVRYAIADVKERTTTSGGTTTALVDTWLRGSTEDWQGSEVFFYDATGGHEVRAYDGAATLTFSPALGSPTTNGQAYLIGDIEGRGWSHDRVMRAITDALTAAMPLTATEDTTLTVASQTWEYAIPATFAALTSVEARLSSSDPWRPLMRRRGNAAGWGVVADQRKLTLSPGLGLAGYQLRLTGYAADALPTLMADVVNTRGGWVRDAAVVDLLSGSLDPANQQKLAILVPKVERNKPRRALRAGTVLLPIAG